VISSLKSKVIIQFNSVQFTFINVPRQQPDVNDRNGTYTNIYNKGQ